MSFHFIHVFIVVRFTYKCKCALFLYRLATRAAATFLRQVTMWPPTPHRVSNPGSTNKDLFLKVSTSDKDILDVHKRSEFLYFDVRITEN